MRVKVISPLVAFLLCVGMGAKAAPVTYNLEGVIDQVGIYSLNSFSIGEKIPISITVDTAYPGGPTYTYTGFGQPPGVSYTVPILSAYFAGLNAASLFQQINNYGNEITFNTAGPMTGSGFRLSLTGVVEGPLASDGLPTTVSAAAGTFSVTEAFDPSFYGFSGTIDSTTTTNVSEPSSWTMLALGLVGLCWLCRSDEMNASTWRIERRLSSTSGANTGSSTLKNLLLATALAAGSVAPSRRRNT